MTIQIQPETVRVSDIPELGSATSNELRHKLRLALADGQPNLEIDLSHTTSVDGAGLGALVALKAAVERRAGYLRVLNPQPAVQQILELARMDWFVEICP